MLLSINCQILGIQLSAWLSTLIRERERRRQRVRERNAIVAKLQNSGDPITLIKERERET